eukprot:m.216197 g.216197  ORF g.216197 m.216197 type:complete len:109 (+) comp39854_c0_seq6:1006-1332(+)
MGGYKTSECDSKDDVWLFSLAEKRWIPLTCEGRGPSARCGHSFTSIDGHRAVLFGGYDGTENFSDLFLFKAYNKEWTEISSTIAPHQLSPRLDHPEASKSTSVYFLGH